MHTLRKFLVLLLMLTLPVQGFAAAYGPMHKAAGNIDSAAQGATMPCHEHPSSSAHHADSQPAGTLPAVGDDTSHQCCHQVFTGITSSAFANPAHKFSDMPVFVLALHTLFIPDSPDRPPRG